MASPIVGMTVPCSAWNLMAWHQGVWLDVQTDLSSLRASDFGLYIFKEAIPLYRLISEVRFRRQPDSL